MACIAAHLTGSAVSSAIVAGMGWVSKSGHIRRRTLTMISPGSNSKKAPCPEDAANGPAVANATIGAARAPRSQFIRASQSRSSNSNLDRVRVASRRASPVASPAARVY